MGLNLFSGLVRGLGNQLSQGYNRKFLEDAQLKNDQMRLTMSALMNDPDLPGSAKRLGLINMGVPEELAASLTPEYEVESGRYYAGSLPEQRQAPQMSMGQLQAPSNIQQAVSPTQIKMPTPPPFMSGGGMMGDGAAPGMQQATPQQGGSFMGDAPMMPRDPMMQPPQILQAIPGQNDQDAAPVMKKYSGGFASKIDEIDAQIAQLQTDLRNDPRNRRPVMQSSLSMSRNQMNDIRQERIRSRQEERELQLGQVQSLMQQKNALQTAMMKEQLERESIAPHLRAEVGAMEQVLGRPLDEQEKATKLGLQPTGQLLERQLEAEDERIVAAGDDGSPEYQAALGRVTNKRARVEETQTQIAANIARLKKGTNYDDPTSYAQFQSQVKFQADNLLQKHFGGAKKVRMIEQRTQEIMAENPDPLGNALNPLQAKAAARKMAKEEVEARMESLKAKYQLSLENGKEPVSRQVAEELFRKTPNPKNIPLETFLQKLEEKGYAVIEDE